MNYLNGTDFASAAQGLLRAVLGGGEAFCQNSTVFEKFMFFQLLTLSQKISNFTCTNQLLFTFSSCFFSMEQR